MKWAWLWADLGVHKGRKWAQRPGGLRERSWKQVCMSIRPIHTCACRYQVVFFKAKVHCWGCWVILPWLHFLLPYPTIPYGRMVSCFLYVGRYTCSSCARLPRCGRGSYQHVMMARAWRYAAMQIPCRHDACARIPMVSDA